MDPTENLREQLRLTHKLLQQFHKEEIPYNADAERLCELVESLDEWLGRGGFLPDQWDRSRIPWED